MSLRCARKTAHFGTAATLQFSKERPSRQKFCSEHEQVRRYGRTQRTAKPILKEDLSVMQRFYVCFGVYSILIHRCVCIYIYIYVCVRIYIQYAETCVYIYLSTYAHVCLYVCMYVCTYVRKYVCTYVYLYM